MAINKVGSKGIEDGSVAAIDFAPNSVTSDKLTDGTITNANLSNSSVTVAGTSIALGASGTLNNKFIDWQSVVVSDGSTVTTMVAGKGYFINTTSAVHTINLPASASIGDFVAIKDYAGTFVTYNLTIGRNGHNIQGVANDSLISTNRASLVLVYVDSTKGWLFTDEHNVADLQYFITATGGTITTSGDFKIHSFTGDGCFVVSDAGPSSIVDYLVVAGGGGGGSRAGGGGAGGGFRLGSCVSCKPALASTALPVSTTTYPVTVGGGGAGGSVPGGNRGCSGSNSVFSTITSAGGGGAGGCSLTGLDGGSGGGGGSSPGATSSGGSGNTPPVSPSQGNNGGRGAAPGGVKYGGGGGGASCAGVNGGTTSGGCGGDGASATPIFGTAPQPFYPVPNGFFSGGGGATAGYSNPGLPGAPGGSGGGGKGGDGGDNEGGSGPNAVTGTTNSGGGGGGSGTSSGCFGGTDAGKDGGSGIVIIRYKFQ